MGAVRLWISSAAPPSSVAPTPTTKPATGSAAAAMIVTSGGPITKVNSSSTDSKARAVCRCLPLAGSEPASRWIQRARVSAPASIAEAPIRKDAATQVTGGIPN